MKIWIVTIGHKHGEDRWAASDADVALSIVVRWVENHWADYRDYVEDTEFPALDQDKALEMFFEGSDRDWYGIEDVTLRTPIDLWIGRGKYREDL